GQHEVQDHYVGPLVARGAQRRLAVRGLQYLVAGAAQVVAYRMAQVGLVVDDQNTAQKPILACNTGVGRPQPQRTTAGNPSRPRRGRGQDSTRAARRPRAALVRHSWTKRLPLTTRAGSLL